MRLAQIVEQATIATILVTALLVLSCVIYLRIWDSERGRHAIGYTTRLELLIWVSGYFAVNVVFELLGAAPSYQRLVSILTVFVLARILVAIGRLL